MHDALSSVYGFLYGRGDRWSTQGLITDHTGVDGRVMRRLCQEQPAMFVSGRLGYKLASQASLEEIDTCLQELMSRAEKILHRARALQKRSAERVQFREHLRELAKSLL